jgi:hypothetical protein
MYEVAVRCSLSVSAEPTKNAPRKATDWPSKNASVKAVPFARPRPLPTTTNVARSTIGLAAANNP